MEKQKVAVDASIVAKWSLDEEFLERAGLLRDCFVMDKLTRATLISILSVVRIH